MNRNLLIAKETMMKKISIALGAAMALSLACFVLVQAQDKYRVSGEIKCLEKANVYVILHTKETWRAAVGPEKKEVPLESGFKKMIKGNGAGSAPFAFTDVPKGDYLIVAFVDSNNNGKCDLNTWGEPTESISWYKAPK
jgi:Uncharacterized protein conserved in bacteria (DUF2141)